MSEGSIDIRRLKFSQHSSGTSEGCGGGRSGSPPVCLGEPTPCSCRELRGAELESDRRRECDHRGACAGVLLGRRRTAIRSKASPPTSASTPARRSTSRSTSTTAPAATTRSRSSASATTAATARARSPSGPTPTRPSSRTRSTTRPAASSTPATGRSPTAGRSRRTRCLASTSSDCSASTPTATRSTARPTRSPSSCATTATQRDIVLQTSDTTWQAYNGWAGNNGQVGAQLLRRSERHGRPSRIDGAPASPQDRAYAVSYNRPFITDGSATSPASGAQDYLFGADYAAIYWLEKNGYDVSYISGVDTDRLGADYLTNYKAFISVGHDEYWSGDQRDNVEAARDAGVNLLFWSGNEVYWKTRWDVAISADGTDYRTLVCYKETWAVADPNAGPEDYVNLDPTDVWTGTWRDMRFLGNSARRRRRARRTSTPITGLWPYCHCGENALTGQLFGPDGTGQFGGALDVPARVRGACGSGATPRVANGGELDIAPGILGYEWDTSPEDELPPGRPRSSSRRPPSPGTASSSTRATPSPPGTATHNLSLYRDRERRAGLRRRHRVLELGPQRRARQLALRCAASRTPTSSSSRSTCSPTWASSRASRTPFLISQGLKRATASDDHVAATATIETCPRTSRALSARHDHRHGDRRRRQSADGRRQGRRGRGLGRRRRHLAGRDAPPTAGRTGATPGSRRARAPTRSMARAIDDSLNVATIVADREIVTVGAPDTLQPLQRRRPEERHRRALRRPGGRRTRHALHRRPRRRGHRAQVLAGEPRRRRHRRPRGPPLARRRHAARHRDLHLGRGRVRLAGRDAVHAGRLAAGVEYVVSYRHRRQLRREQRLLRRRAASSPSTGSTTTASGDPSA